MHELKMPQMGQSVEEASIVAWLKKEGERVRAGEPLFTIQTDKAEIECEAPVSGILRKILVQPDVMVPVLTAIAFIGEPDEPMPEVAAVAGTVAPAEVAQPPVVESTVRAAVPAVAAPSGRKGVSPRARVKANSLGIDPARVTGTGPSGRVLEADVTAYLAAISSVRITPTARRLARNLGVDPVRLAGSGPRGKIMKADVQAAAVSARPEAPAALVGGDFTVVPLTQMRRIIARRMCESMFSAPHYYVTVEIDMTAARAFRETVTTYKLSLNDLVLKAAIQAIKDFPGVNARWAGDAIQLAADVNLGIAVALSAGLVVPVLKKAQKMTLPQMAAATRELIEKARAGKLLPDDYTGNTFTVSNLGPYGVDDFTAIINQPDSAILAVGRMKDRVVAVDGEVAIRPIMKVTMSSDHRVIDGALAAQYMARFKAILETAEF